MGAELDIDDVVFKHPKALMELERMRSEIERMRNRIEELRGLCKSAVGLLRDRGAGWDADAIAALIGDMEPPL